MRRFDDINEADVAILPKSGTLVYSYDPREELSSGTTGSLLYLEQLNII